MIFTGKLPSNFLLIIDSADTLQITPERYHDWRMVAETGGCIVWNRDGEVRVVTAEVMTNALNTLENYVFMVEAGRLVELPRGADRITWEQAINAAAHR